MAKEQFDRERIEFIPPLFAMEPGTEDYIIAYAQLPSLNESVYLIKRQRPPRAVAIGARYDYTMGGPGLYNWQVSRELKPTAKVRSGLRKMVPEYYQEIRTLDGSTVLRKYYLNLEEAYFEWAETNESHRAPFEWAFPGHSELLVLKRENPVLPRWHYALLDRISPTSIRYKKKIGRRVSNDPWVGEHTTVGYLKRLRLLDFINKWLELVLYGKAVSNDDVEHLFDTAIKVYDGIERGSINMSMKGRQLLEKVKADAMSKPTRLNKILFIDTLMQVQHLNGQVITQAFIGPYWTHDYDDSNINHILDEINHYIARVNPAAGKRHYHEPFEQWHRGATRRLAQSIIKRPHQMVTLYITAQKRYFLEIVNLDKNDIPGYGFIRYIASRTAINEYRDADKRFVSEREAFPWL